MLLTYQLRVDPDSRIIYQGKLVSMENTLEAFRRYVNFGCAGGRISTISLPGGIVLVVHGDSKLLGFPVNRALVGEGDHIINILAGNIIAVRTDREKFASIQLSDVEFLERCLPPAFVNNEKIGVIRGKNLPEYQGEDF